VIWLLAIGEGISQKAQEQIAALGAENIIIRTRKPPDDQIVGEGMLTYGLRYDDVQRIAASIPTVNKIIPIRELPQEFTYKTRSIDGRLVGCTPDQDDVASMMVRLRQLYRVDEVLLNESSLGEKEEDTTPVNCGSLYTFNLTVKFTALEPSKEAPRGTRSVPASLGGGS